MTTDPRPAGAFVLVTAGYEYFGKTTYAQTFSLFLNVLCCAE
jgi:hypothetical protein